MKWSRVVTDATTSLFGITPPEQKDEARYALLVIGLILGIGVCSALLLWILIPILMDQK
jgi:H+/gluconate symporter-like permease